MHFNSAHFVNVLKNMCSIAALLILTACATSQPAGQRNNQNTEQLKAAGFALKNAKVIWQDNPSIAANLSFANLRHSPEVHKGRVEAAKEDVNQIMKILRENVPHLLASELEQAGIARGNVHTIVFKPISAYRDESGWGSGAVVRVSITDATEQVIWTTDMDVNSGWQWFGPQVSRPDETYARNLVKGTIDVFKKVKLIK